MRFADCLPMTDIGHEHARTHDVREFRSGFGECRLDDVDATLRLGISVADTDNVTVFADRRRPGHRDVCPAANGTAVADAALPRGSTLDSHFL